MVLCFDEGFFKSICDGVVSCTVKCEDLGLSVGDVVVLGFDGEEKEDGGDCEVYDLVARISNVGVYQFRFLDELVAFKMGFRSVGLLWWFLRLVYPDISDECLCFVYEFELL